MTIAETNYNKHCSAYSDIHEHLPTLHKYASECEHITEMGVREVVSTWAFLHAKPSRLVSYDLYTSSNLVLAYEAAKEIGVNFEFIQANVLDVIIEETDFLFIDTWHKYGQLSQELPMHCNAVKKYIALHDTTKYATQDEGTWGRYDDDRTEGKTKAGLWAAVEEFLVEHPEWIIAERFTNNNGLTILERV